MLIKYLIELFRFVSLPFILYWKFSISGAHCVEYVDLCCVYKNFLRKRYRNCNIFGWAIMYLWRSSTFWSDIQTVASIQSCNFGCTENVQFEVMPAGSLIRAMAEHHVNFWEFIQHLGYEEYNRRYNAAMAADLMVGTALNT